MRAILMLVNRTFLFFLASYLALVSSDGTFPQNFCIDPNIKIDDLLYLRFFELFCKILQMTIALNPIVEILAFCVKHF